MRNKEASAGFERPCLWGSLRLRLAAAVVLSVLVVTGAGTIWDYRREYRVHMEGVRASLTEQAQALLVARRKIRQPDEFAQYVRDLCAQMNEQISPGHHILVLDGNHEILASTRYHSGPAAEEALLTATGEQKTLTVQNHRLSQVRLTDSDGAVIILAQYLDHVEEILRKQLISRAAISGATALALILLIFLALHFWVIGPIGRLTAAVQDWSNRIFATRVKPSGSTEICFLSDKLNAMAEELKKHEDSRNAELKKARKIQANLLPTCLPCLTGLSVAADYRPVEDVAGDLYDVFELSGGRIAFVILDVAGHGISAALLTGVVKMSLHRRLAEREDPAEAISFVNQDLLRCVSDGQFVTVCVGIWESKDRTWTYCAAGHPGGLLLAANGMRHLPSTGPLLGVFSEAEWSAEKVQLHPTDRIFLYTDGVTEVGAPSNIMGQAGLEQVVRETNNEQLTHQVELIMKKVLTHSSGKPEDDVTILAVEVLSEEK